MGSMPFNESPGQSRNTEDDVTPDTPDDDLRRFRAEAAFLAFLDLDLELQRIGGRATVRFVDNEPYELELVGCDVVGFADAVRNTGKVHFGSEDDWLQELRMMRGGHLQLAVARSLIMEAERRLS